MLFIPIISCRCFYIKTTGTMRTKKGKHLFLATNRTCLLQVWLVGHNLCDYLSHMTSCWSWLMSRLLSSCVASEMPPKAKRFFPKTVTEKRHRSRIMGEIRLHLLSKGLYLLKSTTKLHMSSIYQWLLIPRRLRAQESWWRKKKLT